MRRRKKPASVFDLSNYFFQFCTVLCKVTFAFVEWYFGYKTLLWLAQNFVRIP